MAWPRPIRTDPPSRRVLALVVVGVVLIALVPSAISSGSRAAPTRSHLEAPVAVAPAASDPNLPAPSARWGMQFTDDPAENYTLLFSGSSGHIGDNGVTYGDTWTYHVGVWKDISPTQCTNATCPEARTYPGMSYYNHSGQEYVVMFGGQYGGTSGVFLGDTWIFNGSWHNVTPSPLEPYVNSPPALFYNAMAWDPLDEYSVLYGGCTANPCDSSTRTLRQTWAFEGLNGAGQAVWDNLTTASGPPPLYSPALTYDNGTRSLILFGGVAVPTDVLVYMNQTWSYTAATGWVNLTLPRTEQNRTNTPPTRVWPTMVYDPVNHYLVLFAGQKNQSKLGNPTLDDTWTYSGGAWTNITASLPVSPHGRFGGAMAWDPSDNALVLFGGLSATLVNSPVLDDTWWFSGTPGAWTNRTAAEYAIFTESGLSSGARWWVNLTDGESYNSTTTGLSIAEPNGTYNYTVATADKEFAPENATGSFVLNGTSVNLSVTFRLVTFSATFSQTGLPDSIDWWVNLSNGQSFGSNSSSLTFEEPNGTYDYVVATSDKGYAAVVPRGSFTVNGASVHKSVTFKPAYLVTWTESGLPSGTEWWVNVTNGPSAKSTTNSTSFREPNGTYDYTLATSDKEYASPRGSFTVAGSPVWQNVTFALVTFSVTFTETGLPAGTEWWVNVTNGLSVNSSAKALEFAEPNGTYDFSVGTVDKSHAAAGGSFSVNGTAANVTVAFGVVTYRVTFVESGLATGARWWINLTNGQSVSSESTTISFGVANGTYGFSAASPGRSAILGQLVVDGQAVGPMGVTFGPASSRPALSAVDEALIGGAVVVVAVGVVLLLVHRHRKRASALPSGPPSRPPDGLPPVSP